MHWDRTKPDQSVNSVLIEFEDISDDPSRPGLPMEDLTELYPEQKWSPQSSGIQVRPEYREALHEHWTRSSKGNFLSVLFNKFNETQPYADWLAKYREFVSRIEFSDVAAAQVHPVYV